MRHKILIVDDHALVRDGLTMLVSALPGGAKVYLASTAAQALEQAELHTPFDAILLDCGLPDADGANLIQALSRRSGNAPIIVVSGVAYAAAAHAHLLSLGAAAFVSKSSDPSAVMVALKQVLTGANVPAQPIAQATVQTAAHQAASARAARLTARQLDVLLMLDQGLTNLEISLQLGLSQKTVKNHVAMLFDTLGVTSRLHAIRKARDVGLLQK